MMVFVDDCQECGFVYENLPVEEIAGSLRSLGSDYAERLRRTDAGVLRSRPRPSVWSGLEYACHVRDVVLIQRDRILLALVESCPSFAPMYREQRVVLAHYEAHSPDLVADQLRLATDLCATVLTELGREQWARPSIYNFPVPTERDVAWLGRHTLHEAVHHLGDIDRGIAEVRSRAQ
jgi:S-DNA-T family DNA segregation ATPase FtsK/SpoIIIE